MLMVISLCHNMGIIIEAMGRNLIPGTKECFCADAYLRHIEAIRIEAARPKNDTNEPFCVGAWLCHNRGIIVEAMERYRMQSNMFVLIPIWVVIGP